MSFSITVGSPASDGIPQIEEGTYTLKLLSFGEPIQSQFKDGPVTMRSLIAFEICDEEEIEGETSANGVRVSDYYTVGYVNEDGTVNYTVGGPRSKFRPLVAALIGHDPQPGENIKFDELVGTKILGVVMMKDPNANGDRWPTLTSPAPIRRRRGQANVQRPASPPPAATDDPFSVDDETEE
jgi:hypothetical protein